MKISYQPISCDFHSLLEHYATLKEKSVVKYTKDNIITTSTGIITDLYTKNGEEFLVLNKEEVIRLDMIQRINNNIAPQKGESSCSI